MSVKCARVPRDLDASGRALWRSIAAQIASDGLVFDPKELRTLADACHEADQLASIEEALKDAPMLMRGAQGQQVANPLLSEARRSRQTINTLLKALPLEDPATASAGAGRGSRTTSTQARTAAITRHHGAS